MQNLNGSKDQKPTRRELLEQWKQNRAKVETPRKTSLIPSKPPKFEEMLRNDAILPAKQNGALSARDQIFSGQASPSTSSMRKFVSSTEMAWSNSKKNNLAVMTPRRFQPMTPMKARQEHVPMSVDRSHSMQRKLSQNVQPFKAPSKNTFQTMTPMKFGNTPVQSNVNGKFSARRFIEPVPPVNRAPRNVNVKPVQAPAKSKVRSIQKVANTSQPINMAHEEAQSSFEALISNVSLPLNEQSQDTPQNVESVQSENVQVSEMPIQPQEEICSFEDLVMEAEQEEPIIKEEELVESLFTPEEIEVINMEQSVVKAVKEEVEDEIKVEEQEVQPEPQIDDSIQQEIAAVEAKVEEINTTPVEFNQEETMQVPEEKKEEETLIKEEEMSVKEEYSTENTLEVSMSEQKASTSKKRKSEEFENGSSSILEERGSLKKVLFDMNVQENAYVIPQEKIKVEFYPSKNKASVAKECLEISKTQFEQQIEDYGSELIYSVIQVKKGRNDAESVITPVRRSKRLSTVSKSPPKILPVSSKKSSSKKATNDKSSSRKLSENSRNVSHNKKNNAENLKIIHEEPSKTREKSKGKKSASGKKSGNRINSSKAIEID